MTVNHIEHYDTRVTVDDKNFIFSNPEEAEDMYNILSSMMRENALSSCEIDKLKNEINMLKVTIGRNEAYIDRLTHTSEWKTSAYDNKSYHTVLKEWEEEMKDKYSDKRRVIVRKYK